jgi:hypothetical protein
MMTHHEVKEDLGEKKCNFSFGNIDLNVLGEDYMPFKKKFCEHFYIENV